MIRGGFASAAQGFRFPEASAKLPRFGFGFTRKLPRSFVRPSLVQKGGRVGFHSGFWGCLPPCMSMMHRPSPGISESWFFSDNKSFWILMTTRSRSVVLSVVPRRYVARSQPTNASAQYDMISISVLRWLHMCRHVGFRRVKNYMYHVQNCKSKTLIYLVNLKD